MTAPRLTIAGARKRFGGVHALRGLHAPAGDQAVQQVHVDGAAQGVGPLHRAVAAELLREAATFDELHREEVVTAAFADVVDLNEVWRA